MTTEDIKEALTCPAGASHFKPAQLLSTGSTQLNLALSDHYEGGLVPQNYYFMVGDSGSGKSFLTQTCFAEAARNPFYDDYDLLFYNIENGVLMDYERFFGKKCAARVKEIKGIHELDKFYYDFHDRLKRPVIAVTDSMDAFSSIAEQEKFEANKTANKKGTKGKGDYGDGKAKINSRNVRSVLNKIIETNSIWIIVGQTRDNIDAEYWEPPQTFAGGHALKFYAAAQLWSSCGAAISRDYLDHKIELGITCKIRIEKNRITGKKRRIEIPILHSHGLDDTASCVDYLVSWQRWKTEKAGYIVAEQFGLRLQREKLIQTIEEQDLKTDLRDLVGDTWNAIETACMVDRKKEYE